MIQADVRGGRDGAGKDGSFVDSGGALGEGRRCVS